MQTHYFFFTWRTYGTWLPGEDGFVGFYRTWDGRRVSENRHGTPTAEPLPALARFAADQLKAPPVYLNARQADALRATFLRHGEIRRYAVDAIAVMTDHIHLTFTAAEFTDLDRMLSDWKAYASR